MCECICVYYVLDQRMSSDDESKIATKANMNSENCKRAKD